MIFREGLTTSFTKIMTDEAVSSWRFDIQVDNFQNKYVANKKFLLQLSSYTGRFLLLFKTCVSCFFFMI